MKKLLFSLFLVAAGAFAQPSFTVTSLSTALTSNATTMVVASNTGFTAQITMAQIQDELVLVRGVSGTTITIARGQSGTRASNHGAGVAVTVASQVNFSSCGGQASQGPCGVFYNQMPGTHFSSSLWYLTTTPTTITTAGAATYTVGALLGGMILRDPAGSGRTDTLPTAALLVAGIPGATVGTTFDFFLRNDADMSETITVAAGTGGTTSGGGTMTVAQSNAKTFRIRITNVVPGSEAYQVYSLGTVVD